jgi:hypothetical protein
VCFLFSVEEQVSYLVVLLSVVEHVWWNNTYKSSLKSFNISTYYKYKTYY